MLGATVMTWSGWLRAGRCLALAAWALGSGLALADITVVDDRGHTVALKGPAQRVITLLPSLTESVCALQACDRLVGTDRYSNWPASVRNLPKLAGLEDTPIERIVSLKPDVVLAAVSSRAVDRLEALGIRVLALEPKSLQDTRRMLETVATVLGRPGEGERLWASIEGRVQAVAQGVPARFKGQAVYFEVATAPYAAGQASFVGEALQRLGLANIVPPAMGAFPKLNPEFVVRAQPGLVMASVDAVADMRKRPGWASIQALQQGRACAFPEAQFDLLVRPGPRLGEATELVAACLKALPAPAPASGARP